MFEKCKSYCTSITSLDPLLFLQWTQQKSLINKLHETLIHNLPMRTNEMTESNYSGNESHECLCWNAEQKYKHETQTVKRNDAGGKYGNLFKTNLMQDEDVVLKIAWMSLYLNLNGYAQPKAKTTFHGTKAATWLFPSQINQLFLLVVD